MKQGNNYYVYIVECSDKSYYVGVTNDVQNRIRQHNEGINPTSYTHSRRPVVLKYVAHYQDINQAISWEKQIKGWSRKKKQALMVGNWDEIVRLSNAHKSDKK